MAGDVPFILRVTRLNVFPLTLLAFALGAFIIAQYIFGALLASCLRR